MPTTRRQFFTQSAALLLASRLVAQSQSTAHPDVAAIDHDRILEGATQALTQSPSPLTTIPAPRSPGTSHDYYSEAADSDTPVFTGHRDALLSMCIAVPALTAAFVLTKDARYATHAIAHLRAWFVDPATSMTPSLTYAQVVSPAKVGRFEGIVEAVHLAEVVQSIPFLEGSEALTERDVAGLKKWFSAYFEWLNTSRTAGLARDNKSHHGTSWLLQAAAIAHWNQEDDRPLSVLRHQYKASTIRAHGVFPHELTTENPYRNSLFNLDMMAGVCLLLSTKFESVWDYGLQDGPGMRSVIAKHFPYIADRGKWPYPADVTHFNDLPVRPPSLLFAARAYSRPEYADLWRRLPADPAVAELQQTFPIRQPLLWVTRPRA
jgi:hypothetical protein